MIKCFGDLRTNIDFDRNVPETTEIDLVDCTAEGNLGVAPASQVYVRIVGRNKESRSYNFIHRGYGVRDHREGQVLAFIVTNDLVNSQHRKLGAKSERRSRCVVTMQLGS